MQEGILTGDDVGGARSIYVANAQMDATDVVRAMVQCALYCRKDHLCYRISPECSHLAGDYCDGK